MAGYDDAMEILKDRKARGKITKEQYDKMRGNWKNVN